MRSILDGSFDRDQDLSAKTGQALNLWWGMSAGVIDVILSKNLPYYSVKMIDIYRRALINGTFHPFDGELHSQTGIVRGPGEAPLTNEEIVAMDWLNDNVVGRVPAFEELTVAGQRAAKVSGIRLEEG